MDQQGNEIVELIFKVAVVGEFGVGKSTLVQRIVAKGADGTSPIPPTIGVDFHTAVYENVHPGVNVRLQLWDTAGLEQYAAVLSTVYRNAAAVICVYDVNDESTFDAIVFKHVPAIAQNVPTLQKGKLFFIGNKLDLRDYPVKAAFAAEKRPVDIGDAITKLEDGCVPRYGDVVEDAQFVETSALDGTNVEDMVMMLVTDLADCFEQISRAKSKAPKRDVQLGRSKKVSILDSPEGSSDVALPSRGSRLSARERLDALERQAKEDDQRRAVNSDEDDEKDDTDDFNRRVRAATGRQIEAKKESKCPC